MGQRLKEMPTFCMLKASSVQSYHAFGKTFAKGETHMDALNAVKGWIGALTEVTLMLLALGIALALLAGPQVPFIGNVVSNIMSLVGDLGKNGIVGLIALGLILWLFSNRKMA
jgi:hypothetical protein